MHGNNQPIVQCQADSLTLRVPMHTHLADAHALILEGPDANAFARAQFASDVQALEPGHWQWTAWLDARGRVRAFGHLGRCLDGRILCLLRSGHTHKVCAQLQMFRLRAKLEIHALSTMQLGAGDALPMHHLHSSGDELTLGLGDRSLVLSPQRGVANANLADAFLLQDIRSGYAWFDSEQLDALLPATLSLYRLHAVSTSKGCYPGQEIVSRLHHLGGHKQHLVHVEVPLAVSPGDAIVSTEGHRGLLLVRVGDQGLASLRDEPADERGPTRIVQRFAA